MNHLFYSKKVQKAPKSSVSGLILVTKDEHLFLKMRWKRLHTTHFAVRQVLKLLSISVLWGIETRTEKVSVYFHLTCLLPTKSKRRLNVTMRTVMQVRVQCTVLEFKITTERTVRAFWVSWYTDPWDSLNYSPKRCDQKKGSPFEQTGNFTLLSGFLLHLHSFISTTLYLYVLYIYNSTSALLWVRSLKAQVITVTVWTGEEEGAILSAPMLQSSKAYVVFRTCFR